MNNFTQLFKNLILLVKVNTMYLNYIGIKDIKDIKFSDGTLFKNLFSI